MNFKIYILFILTFFRNIASFKNKLIIPSIKNDIGLYMKPAELINYFASFRDYTIITVGDENKKIYDMMENANLSVYYMNLDNIFEKEIVLSILRKDYKNLESGSDFWIFHKAYHIGGKEAITNIINKKNNIF